MDVQLVLGTQRLDDLKEMMSDTAGDRASFAIPGI
jgi:hypothetical protein